MGFTVYVPQATYFVTVDIRPVDPAGDGIAFCRSLPERCRRGRDPERGVLRPPGIRSPHGALRVLQAVAGDRGGCAAPVEGVRVTVLRVAAIQHDIVWHDREANFARLDPMIDAAVAGGAGLILLTETFSTGFSFDTPGIGEPEGGPSSSFLRVMAAQRTGVVDRRVVPGDRTGRDGRRRTTIQRVRARRSRRHRASLPQDPPLLPRRRGAVRARRHRVRHRRGATACG